ncbi:PXMP2/4 family protein 4-like [Salvia splendens]|uniref:PXMP2/4 family protein 4-like n=1 Tax=Salvia splendens TaxID=180675 RepID=UPI001C260B0D|nr:PXMP2/4 family protein 4-like [Salvia splendens]
MRFHFANDFAGTALRRRFAATYNQQCRAYAPFRRLHHFTNKPSPPNRISPSLSTFRRFCSSKSSGSRMGLLGWYLGMLESRPILTKSLSSGLIYAAADTTSQLFTMDPNGTWDPIRTLRIAGFGLFMLGPSQHYWFNFVARVLPNRDLISTLKKMAMGQLVYAPVINGIFFSYNAAAQGENGNEIAARLKRDLIPTLLNGLMYWPLCDFLTYRVVPVHLQPLMNSSCAFLWSIYLTYMASLEKAIPT